MPDNAWQGRLKNGFQTVLKLNGKLRYGWQNRLAVGNKT